VNSALDSLPDPLKLVLGRFAPGAEAEAVAAWLRPADRCMTPVALSAFKSTRVSFARVLARRMIEQRWRIRRERFECDAEGHGHGVYAIEIGNHRLTYVMRSFKWDGVEKVGRRSDGALRDMFGAIFLGAPDENRIAREIATFDLRDADRMRTDSAVTGWTPGSRSARFFDHVVDALTAGRQPDPNVIGVGTGYLLRNGGYLGSGRNGTLSFEGYGLDHPLRHPFFADLFGLYMVRQVSLDLVDGIAKARNPNAARLSPDVARFIGVGNSSGQGMCVALQRWPHWVSTWMTVRELSLAYAKSMRLDSRGASGASRSDRLLALLRRSADYYTSVQAQCEDYVVPHAKLAANLLVFRDWVREASSPADAGRWRWGDLVARAEAEFDAESVEQINSLLVETFPEFADAAADYLPIGADRERDLVPEMSVGRLRGLLRERYGWALRTDLGLSKARQYFWYHSIDNGEQRRGERIVDPHEEFESFIDHIGLIQRLTSVLACYPDDTTVAEMVADTPDLAFAASRVQYLAGLPYCEIRGGLIDRDFLPAHLIRFFLAALGMECTNPLSIRYVRGVFFPGMPLPAELERGASEDWTFPLIPQLAAAE
jgi:hypothetical protein